MPLSASATGELYWWLKHLRNRDHYKIYQLTVQLRQMLANKDGVLKTGKLQLPVDGVLWREIIIML